MSEENNINNVCINKIREFCELVFLKYSNYRLILKNTLDTYPAYELAYLYYEIAYSWFECCKEDYLGFLTLNICKDYLKKCQDVFENKTIDICVRAKLLLHQVQDIINIKITEVEALEKKLKQSDDLSSLDDNIINNSVLQIAENYLILGNCRRAHDYLKFFVRRHDQNELHGSKYSNQLIKLTFFAEIGEIIQLKLELQESLMFIEYDDQIDIKLKLKDTKEELRNELKMWKEDCRKINTNLCKIRFVNEEQEECVKNVLKGKEILIIKSISIGFVNKYTKEYEIAEINDRALIEILKTHTFITNYLVRRINKYLAKIGSEFFLSDTFKNKLIVLANKQEVDFYLYFCFNDKIKNMQIWGDLVKPLNRCISLNHLWTYLLKIFRGELSLHEDEFLHKLVNEYDELFFGNLKKLPLLRTERFGNVYAKLSTVYEYLGHKPLAHEYEKKIAEIRVEKEIESSVIKTELMTKQILSPESGMTLPGDSYLNINETDFFENIIPKLNEIKDLQKCLNKYLKLILIKSDFKLDDSNFFQNDSFAEFYQNEQEKVGELAIACLLIYFPCINSWGLMFKLNETKFSGMLLELCEIKKYRNEFQAIRVLLIGIKQGEETILINEDENQINPLKLLLPNSLKFANSICEIEKIMNIFLQKNFFNASIDNENIIFKNDITKQPKIHDITNIEGIIRLKMEINAARNGYFIVLRKKSNLNDLVVDDIELPQLININNNYFIYSKNIFNEWSLKNISFCVQQSDLNLLEKGFFYNQSTDSDNKIFVSPMQNEFVYHFIEKSFGNNLNSSTKTSKDDLYLSLLKVNLNHYVALCINRMPKSSEYKIFLADPLNLCINFVDFLDMTGKNFKYSFNPEESLILCPENCSSNDTLIIAYIALNIMQSGWNKGYENWYVFVSSIKYQKAASSKNVDLIRKWYERLNSNKNLENKFSTTKIEKTDSSNDIVELFQKFDSHFECLYSETSDNEANDNEISLNELLTKAHKSIKLINDIEKFSFENAVVHNMIQDSGSINLNFFENIDKSDLVDVVRTIITKKQNKIPNSLFENIMIELDAALNSSDKLNQIVDFLNEMFYTEKYDVIFEIVYECQYQFNSLLYDLFDELIENPLLSDSNSNLNLFTILVDFLSEKEYEGFDYFISLSNFITDRLKFKTDLNDLCNHWKKLENIIELKIVKSDKMNQFLANNAESLRSKILFVSTVICHIRNFIFAFSESLINQYGTFELKDIYKLIFVNVENKLLEDVNFTKYMPANKEAAEVVEYVECRFEKNLFFFETIKRLVYILALSLSKRIPKYIAEFRKFCAEYFETFYETIHNRYIEDLNIFITDIEVVLSKRTNLVSKCIQFYNVNKSKSETLSDVITQLNDSRFEKLVNLLSQIEQNRCNTFIYLNNYYPLIETLTLSFDKMNTVVLLLKENLLTVLTKKFNTVTDENLITVLKSQLLDKINANTELDQILLSFENFDFSDEIQRVMYELKDTFEKSNDLKAKFACCFFLKQFIVDLIDKYMQNFLAFREKSEELFNSTEIFISDILSSYCMLRERVRFRKILSDINLNEMSYKNFCDAYVTLIEKIQEFPSEAVNYNQKYCFENLINNFNNPLRHTHLSYYENRFKNLKLLIDNYLHPYQVEVKKDDIDRIVCVNVRSGLLSETIELAKEAIKRTFKPGDELHIINSEIIYIDVDMDSGFSGVNISLIAIDCKLAPMKQTFVICTDGMNAKQHSNKKSTNGKNETKGQNGEDGEDGMNGLPGEHAGNVLIFISNCPDSNVTKISACGGNGSDGQIGGNGGSGGDGANGEHGDKTKCKRNMRHIIGDYIKTTTNYFSGVSWALGSEGQEGGNGGNTGYSGYGGNPGLAGVICFKELSSSTISDRISRNGLPGIDGNYLESEPGEAGCHGSDGLTWVMTADVIRLYQIDGEKDNCEQNIYFYSGRYYDIYQLHLNSGFNSDTDKQKKNDYGFIYRSKSDSYGCAQWCKPYFNCFYDSNDYRLKSKYKCNTRRGTLNKLKNTNVQQAKKINSINTNQIFKNAKNYLTQFCQSESKFYQKWNAKKISGFLNKLSNEMGMNDYFEVNDGSFDYKSLNRNLSNMIKDCLQRLQAQENEISKYRTAELKQIGLVKYSLTITNEIDQIRKNESLWKKVKKFEKQKQKEIIIEKLQEKSTKEQIDCLRVIRFHQESTQIHITSEIDISNTNQPINTNDLNDLAKYNVKLIQYFIENIRIDQIFFETPSLDNLVNYKNEEFIYCLEIIQNDENILNNMSLSYDENNYLDVFNKYLEVYNLDVELEELLLLNKVDSKVAQHLIKQICDALSNSNDAVLLVHKILFIDCVRCLCKCLRSKSQNLFFKLFTAYPNEVTTFVQLLNAFFNLSNVDKAIRNFNGTLRDLKKIILQELLKDTIENCFPNLIGSVENENTKNINVDLLTIFYNRIIYEYENNNVKLKTHKNNQPNYLYIKNKEFENVLENLNDEVLTDEVINDYHMKKILSEQSLNLWPTIIMNIKTSLLFTDILRNSHIDLDTKQVDECLIILNSLKNKYSTNKLNQLFPNDYSITPFIKSQDTLEPFLNLILTLKHNKITFNDACVIKNQSYNLWNELIKTAEYKNKSYVQPKPKSTTEIVNSLKEHNSDIENIDTNFFYGLEENLLKIEILIKNKKSDIDKKANKIDQQELIKNWLRNNEMNEIIASLACGWYVVNDQMPRMTQLTSLYLFIETCLQKKSLLEQINTGEGKTLIVALLCAYLALNGSFIDVVTSNRDLAEDGEKKCSKFFELIGLTSSHNCHNEQDYRVRAYKCNIVYGDVASFQGDILETQFNKNDICGTRYTSFENVYLIVDEVDSMCLDKAQDVLYLSHNIDSLKWIDNVFVYIWISVLTEKTSNKEELQLKIQQVSDSILDGIKNNYLTVPKYMLKYVEKKVKIWTENAFLAKSMEVNDEFIIDTNIYDKSDKKKEIIVIDKDIGIEQYSSKWSNGLAQFLELKYKRKLSVESLKAVFMSNKTFFESYDYRLLGMTGTLGNSISRKFLKNVYNTSFIRIPSSFSKNFYYDSPKIATQSDEWLKYIVDSTNEHKMQPILIITETVQIAELIISELKNQGFSQNKIKSYVRDCDEIEKYYQTNPASKGDIIVATNKGGRGTDIKISEVSNKNHGGLHVILTYLPRNDRIEDQAFGRTSRNGNPGSGQFILLFENSFDEKLKNISETEKAENLEVFSSAILEKKKNERDKAAEELMDSMMKTGILHLDIEQCLFERFKFINNEIFKNTQYSINNYLKTLSDDHNETAPAKICWQGYEHLSRYGLLNESLDNLGGYISLRNLKKNDFYEKIKTQLVDKIFRKEIEEFVINVIKDRWAFWLDSVQTEINESKNMNVKDTLLNKLDSCFHELIRVSREINDIIDLINLTEQPEQQVKLACLFLKQGQTKFAEKCFEIAKENDPLGVAYIGMAYCKIPKDNNYPAEEDSRIKKNVRNLMKKARFKIHEMSRTLSINNLIGEKLDDLTKDDKSISQFVSNRDNFYCEQIKSKMQVLENHLKLINKAIGNSFLNEYVFADGNEKEYEKSKDIYLSLVKANIIYHNRVRREFVDKDAKKLTEDAIHLIKSNFDQSIYEPLIQLLNSNLNENYVREEKFEGIIRDSIEFWEILKKCSQNIESVLVLNKEKVLNQLSQEYKTVFDELTGNYNIRLICLESLPEINEAIQMFGEALLLIKITKDNSIYIYHKSEKNDYCLTQLVEKWEMEYCDDLPDDAIVLLNKNKLFYSLNDDLFNFKYFSHIDNEIVTNNYGDKSKKIYEVIRSKSETDANELILHYTLSLVEVPLFRLFYNQNLCVQISPYSEDTQSQIIFNEISKNKNIKFKYLDYFNVSLDLFDTKKKIELKKIWEKDGFLTKQERLMIKDSFLFVESVKSQIEKFEDETLKNKYKNIGYKNYKQDGLFHYLSDTLNEKKNSLENSVKNFLYLSEIPFKSKKIEAESIIKILHDLKILKSGGLSLKNAKISKYAYKDFNDGIEDIVPTNCKAFVAKIVNLQGDIRSYRDGLKGWLKTFTQFSEPGSNENEIPAELGFYVPIGFHRVLILEENKRFRFNWGAFAVFILGLLQVVAGTILCAFGITNFGNALISEGVSDMVQGIMGMITGEFDLFDWGTSKALSIIISLFTAGVQTFSQAATASGKLTKVQSFYKAVTKACIKLVIELSTSLISHYGIGELMSLLNESITSGLTSKIKDSINVKLIKERLKELRIKKGNIAYRKALHELRSSLSDILKDQTIEKCITSLHTFATSVQKIKESFKKQKPSSGNWKDILVDSGTEILINTAVNGLKTAEIPKVLHGVNLIFEKKIDTINNSLIDEIDQTHELTEEEKNEIDGELNELCKSIGDRISNDLVKFITGISNGVLNAGASIANDKLWSKIDEKLTEKFENKNAKIEERNIRDRNCREIQKKFHEKNEAEKDDNKIVEKQIEDKIFNPKQKSNENIEDNKRIEQFKKEAFDRTREENLADVQLKSNKSSRSITIRDLTTGEIIKVEPENLWSKFKSKFKEIAVIDFDLNRNGRGHFVTGRGSESFIEQHGGNNCFLISYEESLGRKVDENSIKQKRNSLSKYILNHSDRYFNIRKNQNFIHIEGGARKKEPEVIIEAKNKKDAFDKAMEKMRAVLENYNQDLTNNLLSHSTDLYNNGKVVYVEESNKDNRKKTLEIKQYFGRMHDHKDKIIGFVITTTNEILNSTKINSTKVANGKFRIDWDKEKGEHINLELTDTKNCTTKYAIIYNNENKTDKKDYISMLKNFNSGNKSASALFNTVNRRYRQENLE
ncbi:unnamed protein product [Brachionus calyciflorus]|uniref:Uncharacterized protein n=1 Tax=Brachionus calyciflorus TaxID=104777 RepID=A0A813XDS7_9BILA|nr:unnamed protein product [Brachionus calyciflorus]